VRTSSGDFEGAFDVFLALDLAEISLYQRADLFHCQGRLWVDDHLTNKMLEKVSQRTDRDDFQVGEDSGFRRVLRGDINALITLGAGDGGHGQHSADVAHAAIQREFAHHQGVLQALRR